MTSTGQDEPPDFAILAPVPAEHLRSGLDVIAGEPFVAFGSGKWDLFRKVDALRHEMRVRCLIYPSHEDAAASSSFRVSWLGWYVGHVDSVRGAHPQGMKYRPDTTASDKAGHWAVFWHVAGLRELPVDRHLPIGKIIAHAKGTWRKNAPPRGPDLAIPPQSFLDEP